MISQITRFMFPVFPFTLLLLIKCTELQFASSYRSIRKNILINGLGLVVIVIYVLIWVLIHLLYFAKKVAIKLNYTSFQDLYSPYVSSSNSKGFFGTIQSTITSPKDIVYLKLPISEEEISSERVDIVNRTLGDFGCCNIIPINDDITLTTSESLRVIIAIAKTLEQQELSRIQSRFPQAESWIRLPDIPDAEVNIWFSDLQVDSRQDTM
ncbi:MAG: hypothetical protein LRZ84_12160 [Desertifilum sp.]|nr:hypothetical protein [Desertifilum sp.]